MSKIKRGLSHRLTKVLGGIVIVVVLFFLVSIAYVVVLGQMYGMPDETRYTVNCIGKEINALWAHNREVEADNTTEASIQIGKNNKRINELFGELDRVWPYGTKTPPSVTTKLGELDCSVDTGKVPAQHAVEVTNNADGVVVGGRSIIGIDMWNKIVGCTSSVVVERVTTDGITEAGILTNDHCDVSSVIIEQTDIKAKKTASSFLFCDCAFITIESGVHIDPHMVWTGWGAVRISGYEDFDRGEWVEFHGKKGYSLGRVLNVVDAWLFKSYVVDVIVNDGDSGGPFIGLKDRSFGGMNSASQEVGVAFGHAWSTVQQNLDVYQP